MESTGIVPIHEVRLETFDPELDSQRLRDWLRRAPVGYLCWQRPPQDELEAAGLTDLPEDLMDIDIMIGESKAIGQGVGPKALGLLLDRLRTDPLVSFAGRLELVALTFVAGIVFTLVYRKFPNLWAVGIAHGVLGSLVVYIVLGEDPGATILAYLTGD